MYFRRDRPQIYRLLALCGAALVALLAFPEFTERMVLAVLGLTAISLIGLSTLKAAAFLPSRGHRHPRNVHLSPELPFISVHVVGSAAPAERIIPTLDSLSQLNYPSDRFEVILLGDFPKAAEKHCASLGFRHHRREAEPAADSLNTARRLMSAAASHVALVGPGVTVAPHFLRIAAAAFDSRDISHVQFPHVFHGPNPGSAPVEDELRHFFDLYATSAGTGALPAGQLCVIRRDALAEVGGWSVDSVNHGAELGTRLLAAGFQGRFVQFDVATRELPTTFDELANQRVRLAAGHARCLVEACRSGRIPRTGTGNFWRMLQQLSAWLDVQLVALAAAAMAAAGLLFTDHGPFSGLFAIAIALWACAAIAGALPVALAVKGGLVERLRAILVHQALAPAASWGTLLGLVRPQPRLEIRRLPQRARPTALADSISPFFAAIFLLPPDVVFPLLALAAVAFLQISLRRYVTATLAATPNAPAPLRPSLNATRPVVPVALGSR